MELKTLRTISHLMCSLLHTTFVSFRQCRWAARARKLGLLVKMETVFISSLSTLSILLRLKDSLIYRNIPRLSRSTSVICKPNLMTLVAKFR